ncbi:MAG: class II aldolase/adducin family protein [Candidatus Aenigmatarchaeota archaeon]
MDTPSDIIEVGKKLYELGVFPEYEESTFGNISINNSKMIVTGRGVHKGSLTKDDLVRIEDVDFEERVVYAIGKVKPSTEALAHYMIYSKYPYKAIIHVHDNAVLEYAKKYVVPKTEKTYPCGTLELAEEILKCMENNPDTRYIILKQHGSIAFGKNLKEAYELIEKYNRVARDYLGNKTGKRKKIWPF